MMRYVIACALSACVSSVPSAPAPKPAVDPGPIRPPDALQYDFMWRQRVTAIWPSGTRSFDAVLQKQHGELMLVGLSPMGLPGFVLRLEPSGEIRVENRTGQALPFAPEYILADVERVFFPWLPGAPAAGGSERRDSIGPVQVVERYRNGQLAARIFSRTDAAAHGTIAVEYSELMPGEDAPRRVVVENGWFGYRLIIETLEQNRLPATAEP